MRCVSHLSVAIVVYLSALTLSAQGPTRSKRARSHLLLPLTHGTRHHSSSSTSIMPLAIRTGYVWIFRYAGGPSP